MTRCARAYVHTRIHIHTRTLFHLYVERGASPVGGFYRREKIWTCTIPPFFISLFINPSLWLSCEFFFFFHLHLKFVIVWCRLDAVIRPTLLCFSTSSGSCQFWPVWDALKTFLGNKTAGGFLAAAGFLFFLITFLVVRRIIKGIKYNSVYFIILFINRWSVFMINLSIYNLLKKNLNIYFF